MGRRLSNHPNLGGPWLAACEDERPDTNPNRHAQGAGLKEVFLLYSEAANRGAACRPNCPFAT